MRDRGPTDRVLCTSGGVLIWGREATMTILLRLESIHKQKQKKSRSNGRSTTQLLTLFQSLSTSSSLSSSRSFFLSSSATLAEHLSTTQPAILMKSQFLKKQKAEQLFSFRCWWETECGRIDCTNIHTHLSTQNLFNYCTTTKLLPLPLSTTITIRRQ
jgi:hypothetical protein